MFELNKKLNLLLTDFFLKFSYLICSANPPYVLSKTYHALWLNFLDEYGDRSSVRGTKHRDLDFYYHHNDGFINNYLTPTEQSVISNTDLENFFNDVEHGFFHGLMTCFVSYLIINGHCESISFYGSNRYGSVRLEKLFSSCLLHDFLRIKDEYDKHDQQLYKYFPLLDDVVYNHSNPNKNQELHEIIKADRLELRRYGDHLEWLKDTSTVYPKKLHQNQYRESIYLSNEQIDMVDLFYSKIRPALEHVYKNRGSTWFTHVGEIRNKLIYENGKPFPNIESYKRIDVSHTEDMDHWYPTNSIFLKSNYETPPYAVYDERFPFFKFHDVFMQGCVKGVIQACDFKELGGKIEFSGVRDHPYLISDIPLENWTFFFKSTIAPTSIDIEPDINTLIKSNAKGLVAIENIHLFSECYEDFKKRMGTLIHI
tara:strand:- start:947 stop:2224 length:1278 start_codon:yes stop_codon:yes gene_type:complete